MASGVEDSPSQRESQGTSQGPVSINFGTGPMTTSIQFASEEQFNRHGYNVLYQAHAASVQLALMSTQLVANQNTMVPVIHPMFGPQSGTTAPAITAGPSSEALLAQNSFNAPAITAGPSPGALQPHSSLTISAGIQSGALCIRSSATLSAITAAEVRKTLRTPHINAV